MIKYSNIKLIDCSDWDDLIKETYGRPYNFQQQDNCKERGTESIIVPCDYVSDYKNDTIPEVVNGEKKVLVLRLG